MTDYSNKKHGNTFEHEENAKEKANELNSFFCRFENQDRQDELNEQLTALRNRVDDREPFVIHESDVRKRFKLINPRKASGPDGVNGRVLKTCSSQLAVPYAMIFQTSISERVVPACWKASVVTPVPKNNRPSANGDFRPIALTSVVMKSLERLVLEKLTSSVLPLLDPNQFAYKAKRSVTDAVFTLTNTLYEHLDKARCYARATFIDFSSALNTIEPLILLQKLQQLQVQPSLILWLQDFLHERTQKVKVNGVLSDELITTIGTPQGCVLSATQIYPVHQ
eukprot:XP_003731185.1 PREDICTED: RNA-directed DNA polymerase from mobile element jockey-like [Strongylocentrotus purpuratus]